MSTYRTLPEQESLSNHFKDRFVLSYIGIISIERDLEIAIRAIINLRFNISNIVLIIVGAGPDVPRLKRITSKLNLDDYVIFTGWVPFLETKTYINISDICLITRRSNEWSDLGTPHKHYQYMALGKPVITTNVKAIKRNC